MGLVLCFASFVTGIGDDLVGEAGIPLGIQAGNSIKSSCSILLSFQDFLLHHVPPLLLCPLCSWTDAREALVAPASRGTAAC